MRAGMKIPTTFFYIGEDVQLLNKEVDIRRAFCKMRIFVQHQGMQEILPQAYG
jgi:hypothetical protein